MQKLIVILGPTASGKTDLSVKLAKKFKGEIVSADSRQVYKGLDVGSGKITRKEMKGVRHHLLDVANPKGKFTVAKFQKLAQKKIEDIQERGHVPFLVGGTGFYIQSVVDGISIPEVRPNWRLRKKLENEPLENLLNQLLKLDPERYRNIDKKNKRRVIRALEIISQTKKPVKKITEAKIFNALELGIKKSPKILSDLIRKRLIKRLTQGMVTEVRRLRRHGLSFRRLDELGLEYRHIAHYLQEKITYQQMIERIQKESEHFAKRQMTWFKRDKRIKWIGKASMAEKLVKDFLTKNP